MEEKITLERGFVDFHVWTNTIIADENTFKDRPLIYTEFYRIAKEQGLENAVLCVGDYAYGIQAMTFSGNRIVISREMLKLLNEKEVIATLAHEIGHAVNYDYHGSLRSNSGRNGAIIGGISGAAVGGALGAAIVYFLSDPKYQDEITNKNISRRTFLKIGSATAVTGGLTAIATKLGYDQGIVYGENKPEFHADAEAVRMGIPPEDIISGHEKIIKYLQEHNREIDKVLVERSRTLSR